MFAFRHQLELAGIEYSFVVDPYKNHVFGVAIEDTDIKELTKTPKTILTWVGLLGLGGLLAGFFLCNHILVGIACAVIGIAFIVYFIKKGEINTELRPNKELQEKLQTLYADSAISFESKQTEAKKLTDETILYKEKVKQKKESDKLEKKETISNSINRILHNRLFVILGIVLFVGIGLISIFSLLKASSPDGEPIGEQTANDYLEEADIGPSIVIDEKTEEVVLQQDAPNEILDSYNEEVIQTTKGYLIEGGTGHIGWHSGYYEEGVLYIDDYGNMVPVEQVYDWTYRVFDYIPETIEVVDSDNNLHRITACYIEERSEYYIYSGIDNEWISLFEQFPEGYTVTKGVYKDPATGSEETMLLDPIGSWKCIGFFDIYGPYKEEIINYYSRIPEEFLSLIPQGSKIMIEITNETFSLFEGETIVSMPWNMKGQTIEVIPSDEMMWNGYYMVDENTIHEFYADSAIYVYDRVQ